MNDSRSQTQTYLLRGEITMTEPRCNCASLAPCVAQLNGNVLALAMRKLDNFPQRWHLRVFPQSAILRRDPTFRGHRSRLDDG